MPVIMLFFLGLGIVFFFTTITIHYLRIEKTLRNTYILTERKVKLFLEGE